jgi:hypothetical protein
VAKIIFSLGLSLIFLVVEASVVSAAIYINEVMPNPAGDDKQNEWLELYNLGTDAVDLKGFKLKDMKENQLIIDEAYVDGDTEIEAKGYKIIRRNFHANFSLNNSGNETVYLYDKEQKLLDTFGYTDSTEGKTWGRYPDGNVIAQELLAATPGDSNLLLGEDRGRETTPTVLKNTDNKDAEINIGAVKDNNGKVLSNVKVYVNGIYTHHYAPEILVFCPGCNCGNQVHFVECNYGDGVLKLERKDYEDWEKAISVSKGDYLEFSPVMSVVIKEDVDEAALSKEPTKANVKSSTVAVVNSSTPTDETEEESGSASGFFNEDINRVVLDKDSSTEVGSKNNAEFPVASLLIFLGGISFLFAALYPLWKDKSRYLIERGT